MAAVDGVVPPPARSRLAVAAADAMLCLLFASAWVLLAGVATLKIGHLACGMDECRRVVAHAASTAILIALLSFLICGAVAALLLSKFGDPATYTNGSAKTAAMQGIMNGPLMAIHLTSTAAFILLGFGGILLQCLAVKGSRMDRVASIIIDVAPLGIVAVSCFVVIPGFAVKMSRMRRFCCASRSAEPISSYDTEQQVAN